MTLSMSRAGGLAAASVALFLSASCDRDAAPQAAGQPEPAAAASSAPEDAQSPAADRSTAPEAREGGGAEQTTAQPPREKVAAETEALGTLPEGVGLAVGSPIPEVSARDLDGQPVRLRALTDAGPVLLIFYRGGWCPYCSFQVHDVARRAADFEALGVTPVLVSVDRPQESAKLETSYALTFPVWSDSSLEVHEAFGVVNVLDEAALAKLRAFGHDIEGASGQTHHSIAIPSAFVLDGGKVAFAHAEHDYKKRPSAKQLLAQLRTMGYGSE